MDRNAVRTRPTGHFGSRVDLTRNVWAILRQQIFPNRKAVARACGITIDALDDIVRSEEGLQDYLANGCLTG